MLALQDKGKAFRGLDSLIGLLELQRLKLGRQDAYVIRNAGPHACIQEKRWSLQLTLVQQVRGDIPVHLAKLERLRSVIIEIIIAVDLISQNSLTIRSCNDLSGNHENLA